MKSQINFRASKLTKEQLDDLMAYLQETQEGVISTAINNLWHEQVPMSKRQSQELEPGDLIGVNAGSNTHGCRDMAIVRYNGDGQGVVIEATSCTSCWQVGHGADHVFATVGETLTVDPADVAPSGEHWSRTIKWEM